MWELKVAPSSKRSSDPLFQDQNSFWYILEKPSFSALGINCLMALQPKLFSPHSGAPRTELLLLSDIPNCCCEFDAGLGTLSATTSQTSVRATSGLLLWPCTCCCGQEFCLGPWTCLSLWRWVQLPQQSPGEPQEMSGRLQMPKANPQKTVKVPEICAGKCRKQG